MRVSTGFLLNLTPGSFSDTALAAAGDGDWTAKITIPTGQAAPWLVQYIPADRPTPPTLTIRLTVRRVTLEQLLSGLPLYWAIVLAAPRSRRFWRALTLGTVILAGAAPLFCLIAIRDLAAPCLWGPGSWIGYVFGLGSYLGAYAVPYIAPFAIAILLLPELRRILAPWEGSPAADLPTGGAAKVRLNQSGPRRR